MWQSKGVFYRHLMIKMIGNVKPNRSDGDLMFEVKKMFHGKPEILFCYVEGTKF